MKKLILIVLIAVFCLMCSACNKSTENENINSTLSQFAQDIAQNGNENTGSEGEEKTYESVLVDVIGANYFEGRAVMRADDEEIFGEICAVFQVGTNTDERFVTEEWLAVSPNLQVYKYDVALDEWEKITSTSQNSGEVSEVDMANCLYALNEIYRDEFYAEYYDTNDMIKRAVYKSVDDFNNGAAPAMLLGINEDTPSGYFDDPTEVTYMPVYNFSSKEDIYEHFNLYFTQNYVSDMEWRIEHNFLEFDGALYLARGAMGYGAFSINLDTVDYVNVQNNTLIIEMLFFGEPDGYTVVKFVDENGALKIDSYNYLLMYDLHNVNLDWEFVEVPDFLAYASENSLPTAPDLFINSETQVDKYSVEYLGDYYSALQEYVKLLEQLDFNVVIDGYEGYYSAEKYYGDYTVTVNAYLLNEEDGAVVEIVKQAAVG